MLWSGRVQGGAAQVRIEMQVWFGHSYYKKGVVRVLIVVSAPSCPIYFLT